MLEMPLSWKGQSKGGREHQPINVTATDLTMFGAAISTFPPIFTRIRLVRHGILLILSFRYLKTHNSKYILTISSSAVKSFY